MVDRIGIEPMTSCLQGRRSPSWTNSPYITRGNCQTLHLLPSPSKYAWTNLGYYRVCLAFAPSGTCLPNAFSLYHSLNGGANESWTRLACVTGRHNKPIYHSTSKNLYVLVRYYSTPAIFLCGHSMHTGRFYSCFDFTGPSLRPKLSNCCFGSYSDIQLVCIDIKMVLKLFYIFALGERVRRHRSRLHLNCLRIYLFNDLLL